MGILDNKQHRTVISQGMEIDEVNPGVTLAICFKAFLDHESWKVRSPVVWQSYFEETELEVAED